MNPLVRISRDLAGEVDRLRFGPPVTHVYNPLDYARAPHEAYLARYGVPPREVLLVGMNPGPFGMAQTGVPFGEIAAARDWLRIEGEVGRPEREHPKRPVAGFACHRSEGSGKRLWGWAKERFDTPERFFERFFVANYCPLVFLEDSGRNRTPDKLPADERAALFAACDRALVRTVDALDPRWVVGIGRFAEDRIRACVPLEGRVVGCILHPSPANPRANAGWAAEAEAGLRALGIPL